MSRPDRKDKELRLRQDHILESAQKLYTDKDIEDVTMDEIAMAAGYTKRTIYAYFSSKDEIQLAMLLRGFTLQWEMQQQALKSQSRSVEKLRAFGKAYFQFFQQNRCYLRLYAYLDYRGIDPAKARPEIFDAYRNLNEATVRHLREILQKGISQGVFRYDLDIDMTISHLGYTLRVIINRAYNRAYSFVRFSPEKYFQGYLELFLRAITTGGKRNIRKRSIK